MIQTVKTYLRAFVSHDQDDWANLLPIAELAIKNHNAVSIGTSPFFLSHG